MDDASRDVLYSRDTARRKIRAEGQRLSGIAMDRWERSQRRWETAWAVTVGVAIAAALCGATVGVMVIMDRCTAAPAPHVLVSDAPPPADRIVWGARK